MNMGNVHEYAKLLVDLHGDEAEVEVVRRLNELEHDDSVDKEKLELWEKVRKVVREMRGPHAS